MGEEESSLRRDFYTTRPSSQRRLIGQVIKTAQVEKRQAVLGNRLRFRGVMEEGPQHRKPQEVEAWGLLREETE